MKNEDFTALHSSALFGNYHEAFHNASKLPLALIHAHSHHLKFMERLT